MGSQTVSKANHRHAAAWMQGNGWQNISADSVAVLLTGFPKPTERHELIVKYIQRITQLYQPSNIWHELEVSIARELDEMEADELNSILLISECLLCQGSKITVPPA